MMGFTSNASLLPLIRNIQPFRTKAANSYQNHQGSSWGKNPGLHPVPDWCNQLTSLEEEPLWEETGIFRKITQGTPKT